MGFKTTLVPEDVSRSEGDGGLRPTFGRLFVECNREGDVLWMSGVARERLGDTSNLHDAFPAASNLSLFFRDCKNNETMSGIFHRASKPPVPVVLHCVMRAADRLILSVEIRERASDRGVESREHLSEMQSRTLENYFRLLRVQQALAGRLDRGRRSPSTIITEQLERERARLARELHTGAGQAL